MACVGHAHLESLRLCQTNTVLERIVLGTKYENTKSAASTWRQLSPGASFLFPNRGARLHKNPRRKTAREYVERSTKRFGIPLEDAFNSYFSNYDTKAACSTHCFNKYVHNVTRFAGEHSPAPQVN